MTARTRRLVFLSVLVAIMTLPAELILLRALTVPSQEVAVAQWVDDLDAAALEDVAADIQWYPFTYRKEIMRALPGDQRAQVWQVHLRNYLRQHPELSGDAVSAIQSAIALARPADLTNPTREYREAVHAVAERLIALIGREETDLLLYRLGPKDGTFASREPLSLRLSNAVRGAFIPSAAWERCDCSMYAGCYDYSTNCSQNIWCSWDQDWPMCGFFWVDPCDGLCVAGW